VRNEMKEGGKATMRLDRAPHLTQLLSVQQVSELLQVPVGTLYQWRFRREGPPSIRVGRFLRFDPEDVRRWLEERKATAAGIPR
jgi:excisionase family DNA binding protein